MWRYTAFSLDEGYPKHNMHDWYRGVDAALQDNSGRILLLKVTRLQSLILTYIKYLFTKYLFELNVYLHLYKRYLALAKATYIYVYIFILSVEDQLETNQSAAYIVYLNNINGRDVQKML